MTRTFTDTPAVRSQTPVWIGIVGPSGSGKTYSALRVATGMQRVVGGEVFGIDTEAGRMKHYADYFAFRWVPLEPPHSPDDYLAAIEHCVKRGAKTIVIDSFSHVWEGVGGVLEMHERYLDERAGDDEKKRDRLKIAAWIEPKARHRRMINAMLGMPVNFVICLRAKNKLRVKGGAAPEQRGFLPIGHDDLTFELTLKCLLLPGANGVPTWTPEHDEERELVKLPQQFRAMFGRDGVQLSEATGTSLAMWSQGAAAPTPMAAAELVRAYAACADDASLRTLEGSRAVAWASLSKDERAAVKRAADDAKLRVASTPTPPIHQPTHEPSPLEAEPD